MDVDVLANVLGNVWGWISEVFGRIGDVSFYWLLLALALKTAESALIGLGWRNILDAACPNARLPFKTAWGCLRRRHGDQRDCTGTGRDRGDDRHLPIEHPGLVGCRDGGDHGGPVAVLHRAERPDGDRGCDLPAAERLERLALERDGSGVAAYALDPTNAEALWELSQATLS
jgi:hypothetical protein